MSNTERIPNDPRSDVKNPNSADHEADRSNWDKQKSAEEGNRR